MNENTRVQLDEALRCLNASRRNGDLESMEAEARYIALIARRMRLDRDAREDGVVTSIDNNPPPNQAA